jgi:hypothetical protein
MAKQGSIIYKDELEQGFNLIQSISDTLYSDIVSGFNNSNILYSMSSILEDIVLDKYLALFNTAKAINISNVLRNNVIIESFTSRDFYDLDFPVDKQLNLDTQNGDLILPIKSTRNLKVSSIIVNIESNGKFGNSLEGGKNSDVNVILNNGSSEMLEYELITNSWKSPTLYFAATLKLTSEEIANGLYIKTYAEDGTLYPKIDKVTVSLDGETWTDLPSVIDINKADYFIRFKAKKIRFVKIILSQTTYYKATTPFGIKNRYLIGLREVSVKQTTYEEKGEYVSKPFSSGKVINGIIFNSLEESNLDISYFTSADNGSRWVRITPKQLLVLNNIDFGLNGNIDINSIRIRVLMHRTLLPNSKTTIDQMNVNSASTYILKNKPISADSVQAWIGGHITCGDGVEYEINTRDTSVVDKEILDQAKCILDKKVNYAAILKYVPWYLNIENDIILKMNGITIKNDRLIWNIISHPNPSHSILVINQDAFLSGSVPTAQVSIIFKPFWHDNRTFKTQTIKLQPTKPALVPSKEGINVIAMQYSDIAVTSASNQLAFDGLAETSVTLEGKTDIDSLSCWLIETGQIDKAVCPKQYILTPHDNDSNDWSLNPSAWVFEGSVNGTSWVLIDKQDIGLTQWTNKPKAFKLDNDCYFKFFRFRFTENSTSYNDTTFQIANISIFEGIPLQLKKADFDVIDRWTIEIKKDSYSPRWDYLVEYAPCADISRYLPDTISGNSIPMLGLPQPPLTCKLSFTYKYQDLDSKEGEEYYTPNCKEYRIEMI